MSEINLGIVGAGRVAREHLTAIRNIEWMRVVGITSRTLSKAEELSKDFGIEHVCNNLEMLVDKCKPDGLMVLVSADQVFSVTKKAITHEIPFFVEKPPGLFPEETRVLAEMVGEKYILSMVGYNRRYYSVFEEGIKIIKDHGDLLGVMIEGHERFWKVCDKIDKILRSNWIFANSTHTIDLLRFFGGEPARVFSMAKGHKEKRGDQFGAVMEFQSGALGQYISYWYSPGGWGVQLFGEGATVAYRPLEHGKWIDKNFREEQIQPDKRDLMCKPGFIRQAEAFGNMIRTDRLEWPGEDLASAYKTMVLAEKLAVL